MLGDYDRSLYLDTSHQEISFEDFIYKEMIHFSKYDCERSIPNLMDGLKISLRKILYSGFKKKMTSEIKVAQFSGYVSEHSGYHHGEASLNGAIVGMAQDYVGSNNINLLMPNGQFGTRLSGGKDSASERYIFTELNQLTRIIYPDIDDKVLKYLDDDGQMVEPIYYAPIIPMVLVNGSKGIGTGFSTDVMCYNPVDIIGYLLNKLQGKDTSSTPLMPYYEGFKGTISSMDAGKYLIRGVYEKVGNDSIRITELPIGTWTDDYKKFLEDLIDSKKTASKKKSSTAGMVRDYTDMSTDKVVDITIQLAKGSIEILESETHEYGLNGIEKSFKLYTTNTTSNMHMFDAAEKLKLYKNVYEIMDDYFDTRMAVYVKRKQYIIDSLNAELVVLSNRAKYIQENLDETIDLRRKKKDEIITLLKSKNYDMVDEDEDYKYLVKMPMDSVSEENVAKIMKSHEDKMTELELCITTTESQMWITELETLSQKYNEYKSTREKNMCEKVTSSKPKTKPKKLKLKA